MVSKNKLKVKIMFVSSLTLFLVLVELIAYISKRAQNYY